MIRLAFNLPGPLITQPTVGAPRPVLHEWTRGFIQPNKSEDSVPISAKPTG